MSLREDAWEQTQSKIVDTDTRLTISKIVAKDIFKEQINDKTHFPNL